MTSEGQVQDLKQSSGQALLGLLRSIAPDAIPENGQKLNEKDIKRVNEKLIELLGKDVIDKQHLDEDGRAELVNEEGLPIIDITEPAEDVDSPGDGTTSTAREDKLIPLASLPVMQRERLRQERERILDMLEEEETLEEQRKRGQMLEEKRDIIRKKIGEAAKERDKSREMQKKMGRALLGKKQTDEEKNSDKTPTSTKPKKSVSFAAEPQESTKESQKPEPETWGDISLARLRPMSRPTLLTKVDEAERPMKTKVVERKPVGQAPTRQQKSFDSDDESDPQDGGGEDSLDEDQGSPHSEQPPGDSASESDATNESLEDLDFAQHQREIALEYYAKRGTIGQAAAQSLTSHSHPEDDQKRIALDVGVTEPRFPKPALSHFKASKLASSYNASIPSQLTSPEGSALPASGAKTLQQTIRMGKLDSKNQLVGTDSESEGDDEAVKQVLDLLSKGGVYNVGPEGSQTVYAVPPSKKAETAVVALDTTTLPSLTKPKTSKFKVDRSQAGLPKTEQSQAKSTSFAPTPSTTSPTRSAVVERRPPGSSPMPSTIIDSPSFPAPKLASADKADKARQSVIIDSHSSTPFSMIVESPSFPPPSGATGSKPNTSPSSVSTPSQAAWSQPKTPKRPARPPAVMASIVCERPDQPTTEDSEPTAIKSQPLKPKKVSRFLAERT